MNMIILAAGAATAEEGHWFVWEVNDVCSEQNYDLFDQLTPNKLQTENAEERKRPKDQVNHSAGISCCKGVGNEKG